MLTITLLKGLPASGKSTHARKICLESPGSIKIVNKDALRDMIDAGKWSRDNEKFILKVRDLIVRESLAAGKHVIVDDTNFAASHENKMREIAKECGARLIVDDIFVGVPLEECIERDRKRLSSVGEKVIRDMHKRFIAAPVVAPVRDPNLPDCYIVDIDGTVALMNERGPYEWDKVGSDRPNAPVIELVQGLRTGRMARIYVSGRDACCKEATEAWLRQHLPYAGTNQLYMRPAGDTRDDRIVKREIYENHIKGRYNVVMVIDDRAKVVEMWRSLGLTCIQVAEGDF